MKASITAAILACAHASAVENLIEYKFNSLGMGRQVVSGKGYTTTKPLSGKQAACLAYNGFNSAVLTSYSIG